MANREARSERPRAKKAQCDPRFREVFTSYFSQAIDAAVDVLKKSGVEDEKIWRAYESALANLLDSTAIVNDEFKRIAA